MGYIHYNNIVIGATNICYKHINNLTMLLQRHLQ